MAVELGTGYVTIIPSAKGIAGNIKKELSDPIKDAADEAGETANRSLTSKLGQAWAKIRGGANDTGTEVTNLGKKVGGIGGAFNEAGSQLKSQFGGVSTSILGAAATPAVLATAVAAAGAVAIKGVKAYEDLGLSVGKFSDATGLGAEASSRLIEVANDAGVATDGLQRSIGFLQKAAGNTPKVFEDLGVAIAHTSSGAVDVQQTFLNATDAIKGIQDPNEKAAAAAKLFGRSWQDMAELINRGSGRLRSDLESVQASKVFTSADVESARGLRDAFDSISDALDGVLLSIGRALAPALTKLAPMIADLVNEAGPLVEALGDGLSAALEGSIPLVRLLGVTFGPVAKTIQLATDSLKAWEDVAGGMDVHTVDTGTPWYLDYSIAYVRDAQGSVSEGIKQYSANQAEANRLTAEAAPYVYEQARAQRAANAEAERYTGIAAQYASTQAAVNGRLDELATKWRDVMSAGADVNREVGAFSKTLQQVGSDAEASTLAGIGLSDAYVNLTDSVKKNGNQFDINTQAGRDNFRAISDVADNIRTNLVQQLKDAGGNYEQVTKSADLYREQLVAQLTQAGFTQAQIQSYIETLGLTPEQVETSIELSGQAAAQQAVDALNVSLDTFDDPEARKAYVSAIAQGDYETALSIIQQVTAAHDKTINYVVATKYTFTGDRGNGVNTPTYSGGPVVPGQGYLVGDGPGGRIGPYTEAFYPTTRGTVLSSGDLKDVLMAQANGPARATPGGINIGEVHVHDELDLDGLLRGVQFAMAAAG